MFVTFDFYINFDHSSYLKNQNFEKIKYILKLHYVINHIIFDFFITLIFLNKTNGQSWCKSQRRQTFVDRCSMLSENMLYLIVVCG
jgi:hypothetical protein